MRQPSIFADFGSLKQQDNRGTHSKYELLRDLISARIHDGTLRAGDALPSEQQLAGLLGMARSTVRQALSVLERDGLVQRIQGRGTFIHSEASQRLHATRRRTQSLLALLLPEPEKELYPDFQKHFVAAAAGQHQQVVVCNLATTPHSLATTIDRLIQLNVSGVAFVPPMNPSLFLAPLQRLQERRIPVVCCYRPAPGLSSVLAFPFEEIGQAAGTLIAGHGHQHVLFCAADQPDTETWKERGFRNGMGAAAQVRSLRLNFSSLRAFHCESSVTREVDRLFCQDTRPTAVFCAFDSLAELFYLVMSKRGIRIPEDVSLVGFGGQERHSALAQRLTSIVIDEAHLGELAVNMLCSGKLTPDRAESVQTSPLKVQCYRGDTLRMLPKLNQAGWSPVTPAQSAKQTE